MHITKITLLAAVATAAGIMAASHGDQPRGGATTQPSAAVPEVLSYSMKRLDGPEESLAKYQGKVLLIVNTASKCGYTKQYTALEAIHKKYADKGFAVVGFPSDDFKNQEFGSDAEIATFCQQNYGVTFDLFSKVDVKGESQAPLFKYLTTHAPDAGEVKWNFEKFLIGKDGTILARFRSKVTPDSAEVTQAIEAALAK